MTEFGHPAPRGTDDAWHTHSWESEFLQARLAISLRVPTAAFLEVHRLIRSPVLNLPWGVDIWHDKKVLNIEWAEDGRNSLINFRRGPWEAHLLALASSIHSPSPPLTLTY